ncbi:MAG: hypothetical protein V1653_00135 [bacterium]
MKKSLFVYIFLTGLIMPLCVVRGEEKSAGPQPKKELTSEETEIINNYEFIESFDMLKELDLFDNYDILVDTGDTVIKIKEE